MAAGKTARKRKPAVPSLTFKTQPETAAWLGVMPKTLEGWLRAGCPGKPGRYALQPIVKWVISRRQIRSLEEPTEGGESSPALEEKRRYEAALRRLDLAEREGHLVEVTSLRTALSEFSQLIRTGGEALGRKYGADAQDLLNETLSDGLAVLRKLFADADSA